MHKIQWMALPFYLFIYLFILGMSVNVMNAFSFETFFNQIIENNAIYLLLYYLYIDLVWFVGLRLIEC